MRNLLIIILIPFLAVSQIKSDTVRLDQDVSSLVPQGQAILEYASGDLNMDGLKDLVLVTQSETAMPKIENEASDLTLFPRALTIYLGKNDLSFTRVLQNDTFIINSQLASQEEPFEGVEITSNGSLKIYFEIFFNAGSWYRSTNIYTFRLDKQELNLTGFDKTEVHRGTGDLTAYSLNFISKKMSVEHGHISKGRRTTEWSDFKLDSLKTIDDLKVPFEWFFKGIQI